MVIIEKSDKTKEGALEILSQELQIPIEDLDYTVVEEGGKGFLNFLNNKTYKIRVEIDEEILAQKRCMVFLEKVLTELKMDAKVEVKTNNDITVANIKGNTLGFLIGRRGQALDALQYLTNLVVNEGIEKRIRVVIYIEGYRAKREEVLRKMALRIADEVRKDRRKTVLEPMNPHERRIIHCTLQNEKGIFTYSEGEDPYRRVIISPDVE